MSEYTYPDLYAQNQKKSASHTPATSTKKKYAVDGYTPPPGITGVEGVKEMQRWLGGLTVDGMWGRS